MRSLIVKALRPPALVAGAALLAAMGGSAQVRAVVRHSMPFVGTSGTRFVADGKPLILRGCNLGCWLLFEPWMQAWHYPDQYSVEQIFKKRFGAAAEHHLMQVYRANFIRNRDFKLIRKFNFNVVRVPFNYQLLEHVKPPYAMRHHPFYWLDRAVALGAKNHIYVILDMHAAPGRQSIDGPTGRIKRDKLWTSRVDQQRTINLWRAIAAHFHGNPTVAGYDLLNEPYGNFHQNMAPKLLALMPKIYQAVRAVDHRHIMFMPNLLSGSVRFWGRASSHGWTQVAYTSHFYPGLFGNPPGLATMAWFIDRRIPSMESFIQSARVPFYVGEFNVVLNQSGGPAMMRKDYDTFAANGWAATMWSYKLIKPQGGATDNSWYMVSNANNLPAISVRHSSKSQILAYFKSMGTIPLAINRPLLDALTSRRAPRLDLPYVAPPPVLPTHIPHGIALRDWRQADIGGARRGGQKLTNGYLAIFGSGTDIFNRHDSFHFLYHRATENFSFSATLMQLLQSSQWAKAGLMLRESEASDSAFAMINAIPGNMVAWTCRPAADANVTQTMAPMPGFPVRLKLVRTGFTISGFYRPMRGVWKKLGSIRFAKGTKMSQVGFAVLSHKPWAYTCARFSGITFKRPGHAILKIADYRGYESSSSITAAAIGTAER
jgi:glucan 1,3-beta-glucosidase